MIYHQHLQGSSLSLNLTNGSGRKKYSQEKRISIKVSLSTFKAHETDCSEGLVVKRWCGGRGGGGQCLFEGIRSYPLPNYRPRFLGLSVSEYSLTAPSFLGAKDHHPLKCKIVYKRDSNFAIKHFMYWISCISQNRVKTKKYYKFLPSLGSQFEVDHSPFLPSKELTAPRFWRSPLPFCVAVWQRVAIQYLSALPPPYECGGCRLRFVLWPSGGGSRRWVGGSLHVKMVIRPYRAAWPDWQQKVGRSVWYRVWVPGGGYSLFVGR